MIKKIASGYFGGALSATLLTGLIWLLVQLSVLSKFNISWSMPNNGSEFLSLLYKNTFWGGLAGCVFLIPLLQQKKWLQGLVMSLIPALVMLFYYIPTELGGGLFARQLGTYAFAAVIISSWLWGFMTLWVMKQISK